MELEIVDKELANYRRVPANKGTKIKIPKLDGGKHKVFAVDFTQEQKDEEDESINCKNYPNENFKTFCECDLAFVRKTID